MWLVMSTTYSDERECSGIAIVCILLFVPQCYRVGIFFVSGLDSCSVALSVEILTYASSYFGHQFRWNRYDVVHFLRCCLTCFDKLGSFRKIILAQFAFELTAK